jgi:hypothetical protein
VIDTKSSRGRVQIATVGIIDRHEQLLVNGRDRTSQLDSLERQMERVTCVLVQNDAGDVSVSERCASRSCAASGCTTTARATD